jgi:hypothetical protein
MLRGREEKYDLNASPLPTLAVGALFLLHPPPQQILDAVFFKYFDCFISFVSSFFTY